MDPQHIHIDDRKWRFRSYGKGEHLLIAFHGFGEDGSIYATWEKELGEAFRIIAVDLPFHGGSTEWTAGTFHPDDLVAFITFIIEKHQPSAYSLLGHSFGARILIASWKKLIKQPTEIWLLAPDGLATRRLSVINQLPTWLRSWIARGMGKRYEIWIWLAQRMHRLGWVDAFSVRYVRHHLSTDYNRYRLMGSWLALPYFKIDRDQLLKEAVQEHTKLYLVLGKKDPLIDWGRLSNWLKKWPASNLYKLDAGHNLINKEVASLIRSKDL